MVKKKEEGIVQSIRYWSVLYYCIHSTGWHGSIRENSASRTHPSIRRWRKAEEENGGDMGQGDNENDIVSFVRACCSNSLGSSWYVRYAQFNEAWEQSEFACASSRSEFGEREFK